MLILTCGIMKTKDGAPVGRSLNMKSIFKCMMEEGYYPVFEKNHIEFGLSDNTAVVEYEDGILSVRVFFSIEKEMYQMFLKAANATMLKAYVVKPVVLDDMKNLMFSCETMCDTVSEVRKFMPRSIDLLREALDQHKKEMKQLLLNEELASKTIPATDDFSSMAGNRKSNKVFS
jgi:hypothetical protein